MTTLEHPVHIDIQSYSEGEFDPLREFYGQWNTRLAEHYWSWLNHMFGKWECVNGKLLVAPSETFGNV